MVEALKKDDELLIQYVSKNREENKNQLIIVVHNFFDYGFIE
jgi:hypothetical protein